MEGKNEVVVDAQPMEIMKPMEAIARGKEQATALMSVCKPISIQGHDYLRFEDWQTLARFNGLSVGADSVEPVEYEGKKGYKAHAVVRNREGVIVGEAVALCLREGSTWGKADVQDYALASMAQTRASAKALRNQLAWIAVLAGVEPTPAEEMQDVQTRAKTKRKPAEPKPEPTLGKGMNEGTIEATPPDTFAGEEHGLKEQPKAEPADPATLISGPQQKRLFAIAKSDKDNHTPWPDEEIKKLLASFGYDRTDAIQKGQVYNDICEKLGG